MSIANSSCGETPPSSSKPVLRNTGVAGAAPPPGAPGLTQTTCCRGLSTCSNEAPAGGGLSQLERATTHPNCCFDVHGRTYHEACSRAVSVSSNPGTRSELPRFSVLTDG